MVLPEILAACKVMAMTGQRGFCTPVFSFSWHMVLVHTIQLHTAHLACYCECYYVVWTWQCGWSLHVVGAHKVRLQSTLGNEVVAMCDVRSIMDTMHCRSVIHIIHCWSVWVYTHYPTAPPTPPPPQPADWWLALCWGGEVSALQHFH